MTGPLSNYELLARHFGDVSPNPKDIAQFILLNADSTIKTPGMKKPESLSLMGRIFDILSRGNYAAAEFFKGSTQNELGPLDPRTWEGVVAGVAGKRKTTFQDVLKENNVLEGNDTARAALGLGLDIFADPTTYIPVAGIASRIKSGTRLGRAESVAAEDLADKSLGQRLLDRGEPAHPESFGLPPNPEIPHVLKSPFEAATEYPRAPLTAVGETTTQGNISFRAGTRPTIGGQPTLPGMENLIGKSDLEPPKPDVPKIEKEVVGNQRSLPFPGFSVKKAREQAALSVDSAADVIEKITKGDPVSVARTVPAPRPKPEARHIRDASTILDRFDPSKARAILNKSLPDTINAKQQVRLYYMAIDAAKRMFLKPNAAASVPKVESHAHKIYTAIEDLLESQGKVFRVGTGENVKLGDVINGLGGAHRAKDVLDEFAKDLVKGSPTWQVVQGLRAGEAIKETPIVKNVIEKVIESRGTTTGLSDAVQFDFDKFLKKFGKESAKAAGASPASINAVEKIIDTTLRAEKNPAQIAVQSMRRELDEIVASGRQRAETNKVLTRALEKDLGTMPRWAVNDNKAVEFVMGRVATWWGQKDLRPMTLNAIGAAHATATARAHALDNMFAPYNQAQRSEAMHLAQGNGVANTSEVEELATAIKTTIDNLVGQANGESVLLRSAVDFDLLNRWMRKYHVGFEFTKGKVKHPITGETVNYSNGSDWVNSWKTANITEDPKVFVFKLQQALEQATREKAVFTELGERFGATTPGKGFRHKIDGHPYLEGYYFTEDIARQIPRMVKDWSVDAWRPNSDFMKFYDRILSMWKSGVTIYRPGHHIRNMIGDVYLGWMDGVNGLRPYTLAARVQRSMRGAYETLADVDRLVEVGAMSRNLRTPAPNEIIFRNRSGVPFTAEQIAAIAHQKGLLEHASTLEDIIDMGEAGGRGLLNVQPAGGRIQRVARGASELQSHNARLAHFIDKVMKSRGSNLLQIFEEASRRARKWHPSGLDLTDFEKKYMRRIMPFYTWMRKSTPLLVEGMVMNPGKSVMPAKAYEAIQESQGIDSPGRHDPFPVDQMFPDWIRSEGLGPIGLPEGILGSASNQTPPGYVMAGMGVNPLAALMSQVQEPGRTAITAISPAAQIPIELATGRKLFTSEPITGPESRPGSFSQYVGENIPIWSAVQGITGVTPTGGETKKASRSDTADREALINWLTGLGIRGTGPYIKQARTESTQEIRTQRKYQKEELMQKLREGS